MSKWSTIIANLSPKRLWLRRRGVRVRSRRYVLALLFGVAIYGGLVWVIYHYTPDHNGLRLGVAEAFARSQRGEILLVDIRRPDEWQRTGLPATAVPLDMQSNGFLMTLAALRAEQPDVPLALICAGGVRSARLLVSLQQSGMHDVLDVAPGMFGSAHGPGWLQEGLPVVAWMPEK